LTELKRAFKGVDAILHAGPVGDLKVIDQLEDIAPVAAVCGNAESYEVRSELYVKTIWRSRGFQIGLIHGYGPPYTLNAWLLKQFENEPVDAIIYGSHFEPKARQVGDVYFFNPGSFSGQLPEGSRGSKGPSRVGLLYLDREQLEGQSLVLNKVL
jgi:putative phosphoesterase